MHAVYILYSSKFNKIYIGFTSDLPQRMDSHNIYAKKGYTVKYRPWKVIYTEEYASKNEALKREKQLKSAKGREFVWEVIRDQQL